MSWSGHVILSSLSDPARWAEQQWGTATLGDARRNGRGRTNGIVTILSGMPFFFVHQFAAPFLFVLTPTSKARTSPRLVPTSSREKVGSLVLALHFSSACRSCWNMEIATRFPRAVGRVENLILVFHAFHRPSFQ